MAIIAIDVGGTKIKGALFSRDLTILKSIKVPTQAEKGKTKIIDTIKLLLDSLQSKKHKTKAIGIAFPGFCNEKGKILFAGSILKSFVGTNLQKILETRYKVPVIIRNDADCFTLAEHTLGAGKKYHSFLGVTWGSGIGCGLVSQNQLFAGNLELGHIRLYEKGRFELLETLCGGYFLTKKYKVATVAELAKKKPKAFNHAIDRFAQGLAIAINITNPQVIIMGGGASNIKASQLKRLENLTNKLVIKPHKIRIIKYEVGEDAGLQGAALLALQYKKPSKQKSPSTKRR